jgi:hypothetical protein
MASTTPIADSKRESIHEHEAAIRPGETDVAQRGSPARRPDSNCAARGRVGREEGRKPNPRGKDEYCARA